jgi:hypothetical protein
VNVYRAAKGVSMVDRVPENPFWLELQEAEELYDELHIEVQVVSEALTRHLLKGWVYKLFHFQIGKCLERKHHELIKIRGLTSEVIEHIRMVREIWDDKGPPKAITYIQVKIPDYLDQPQVTEVPFQEKEREVRHKIHDIMNCVLYRLHEL